MAARWCQRTTAWPRTTPPTHTHSPIAFTTNAAGESASSVAGAEDEAVPMVDAAAGSGDDDSDAALPSSDAGEQAAETGKGTLIACALAAGAFTAGALVAEALVTGALAAGALAVGALGAVPGGEGEQAAASALLEVKAVDGDEDACDAVGSGCPGCVADGGDEATGEGVDAPLRTLA